MALFESLSFIDHSEKSINFGSDNIKTMVRFQYSLAVVSAIAAVEGFSSIQQFSSKTPSSLGQSRFSGTQLNAVTTDPFPLERSITPEGYGFSSSIGRVLKQADRGGGYYKAASTDIVTDVMDGITGGDVDAALVFDETSKLLGIFTESDYIRVRCWVHQEWNNIASLFLTLSVAFI